MGDDSILSRVNSPSSITPVDRGSGREKVCGLCHCAHHVSAP
jgi:hypothetical protein